MNTIRFTQFPPAALFSVLLSLFAIVGSADAREPAPEIRTVDAEAAAKLLEGDGGVTVLDIRTPAEFAEGHIRGAVNIDFLAADFAEKIAELDGAKPFIVHCRSGARSTKSMAAFRKLDFRNIYHLDVGMNGWVEAGKPVVK